MELDRKKKSVSFSVEEQLRLLDLINKEKNIIENKTTNKFTNDEKISTLLKSWHHIPLERLRRTSVSNFSTGLCLAPFSKLCEIEPISPLLRKNFRSLRLQETEPPMNT
ncbi:hypothetical protein JTB14_025372 [Gonioctena quinquepunctata]|nr:hypothetical protein JTB14_025372 [Gonioctena quinquepunctata]